MHSATAELIEFLPGLFDFLLAPAAFVLLLLGLFPKPRQGSALGLLAIAMTSVVLLFVDLAAVVILGWDYLRMAFNLLLDLGPVVSATVLTSLFHGVGVSAADIVPMIATTAGSSIAAIALRARNASPPIVGR